MSSPGNNPPTDSRSGRLGAFRDSYGKAKAEKPAAGERRPWYKWNRRAKQSADAGTVSLSRGVARQVKTFGPRGTVHLLPTRDPPMWSGALSAVPQPRSPFKNDVRLTADQTEAVVAAIADAVVDVELTLDELTDAIVARVGSWAGDLEVPVIQGMWPRWRQAQSLDGFRGAFCFGENRSRSVTYASPRRWLPDFVPTERPAAMARIAEILGANALLTIGTVTVGGHA